MATTKLPETTAETISQMTAATQAALQSRCSRMDVELPPGASLGVEAGAQKRGSAGLFGLTMPSILSSGGDLSSDSSAAEEGLKSLQRGDRELARLYTEMFRPIGEAVTVAFGSEAEAAAARKVWGKSTRVVSLTAPSSPSGDGGKFKDFDAAAAAAKSQGEAWSGLGKKKGAGKSKVGSRKGGKGKGGFAAKMKAATAPSKSSAADASAGGGGGGGAMMGGVVPADTEVLVVVAPKGEAELNAVEAISREAGMGCCVVLLNARLEAARYASTEQRDFFLEVRWSVDSFVCGSLRKFVRLFVSLSVCAWFIKFLCRRFPFALDLSKSLPLSVIYLCMHAFIHSVIHPLQPN